jgi:hypothetical protein
MTGEVEYGSPSPEEFQPEALPAVREPLDSYGSPGGKPFLILNVT